MRMLEHTLCEEFHIPPELHFSKSFYQGPEDTWKNQYIVTLKEIKAEVVDKYTENIKSVVNREVNSETMQLLEQDARKNISDFDIYHVQGGVEARLGNLWSELVEIEQCYTCLSHELSIGQLVDALKASSYVGYQGSNVIDFKKQVFDTLLGLRINKYRINSVKKMVNDESVLNQQTASR
jgi:hypothetical protein